MKVLNLNNPKKTDIGYKISKFPDGQQQVHLNSFMMFAGEEVELRARLRNFMDLELIICATQSLRNAGFERIHLFTPYFLGARSDRDFKDGSNNYLKQVICPIINSMNFKSVTVLDPHSDCLEMGLDNFKKEDNKKLVAWALENWHVDYQRVHFQSIPLYDRKPSLEKTIAFISPDAGAVKKIFKVVDGPQAKILVCSKTRDAEGKLTQAVVPVHELTPDMQDVFIIDDICDGGGTFINICKKLRETYTGRVWLIVTHGVFSKGVQELGEWVDGIYCTNSYSDVGPTENYRRDELQKNKNFVIQMEVI